MSNKLLLFILASFLFWACNKNDITDPNNSGSKVTTTITGIVTNEAGQLLQGVSVTVGGKTTLTDKEGLFLFEGIQVPESRYYVKATLSNYFESGVGGIPVKNGVSNLQIKLMGMGTARDVSATAASTNIIGGATLKFDAGSFVNQNDNAVTSGTVRVYVRSLNPSNPNFADLVPGGDLNSTMSNGSLATLESYGMVGVELRDANNNELKLASGKQAEIRFPIASSQLTTAPAEIPLLSMDPETGVWKQEGVATKVGSEYVGKVSHFSWWNCDVPQQTCRIRGRVVDCNGKPVSGATVVVNGQFSMITNSNGYYERNAPRIRLTFQVKMFGANQNLTSSVTLNSPQPGLNIIPDIRLNTGSCPTYITGTLNRCNSTKTFYIRALWGQNNVEGWMPLEIKGDSFRLTVPHNKQLIIRISSGTFTKDTVIGALASGQNKDIGLLLGCDPNIIFGTVTDIDGNIYKTVRIGSQTWMVENLRVSKYRNGNSIPEVTNQTQWANLTSGAWCNFTNNASFGQSYGKLYNWHAVKDIRGICPVGWRIPTKSDYQTLINYLGGDSASAIKLMETGTNYWKYGRGNNSSSFSARGGSWRGGDGSFYYWVGDIGFWWTSTKESGSTTWDLNHPWVFSINGYRSALSRDPYLSMKAGASIRCIKE